MTEEHERLLDAARRLPGRGAAESTDEQFARYATRYLTWCEAHDVDALAAATVAAYRQHLADAGLIGTDRRRWYLRKGAIGRLQAAAADLERRAAIGQSRWRTRHLDLLEPGSALASAVSTIQSEAASEGTRTVLRSDLALVLDWCHVTGRDAAALTLLDIASLREWLRAEERSSTGPLVAARKLRAALSVPDRWWE